MNEKIKLLEEKIKFYKLYDMQYGQICQISIDRCEKRIKELKNNTN